MSKAILEFDLSDPDDRREFAISSRASDLQRALSEFAETLRRKIKYLEDNQKDLEPGLEESRKMFWEIIEEFDLKTILD